MTEKHSPDEPVAKKKPGPAPKLSPSAFEWVVDVSTLAHVLGVNPTTISKLVLRGMPKVTRGKYHLPTCVQWYFSDQGGVDPEEAEEVVRQRTRLYEAQADSKILDNLTKSGELALVTDWEVLLQEIFLAFVSIVSAVPARAAADFTAVATEREARDVIQRHINECGTDYHRRVVEIAGDIEALGEDPFTATG